MKLEITATTFEDKNSARYLYEQYSAIALLLSTDFSSFSQKDVEKASDFEILLKDKPKGTKFKITIEEIQ